MCVVMLASWRVCVRACACVCVCVCVCMCVCVSHSLRHVNYPVQICQEAQHSVVLVLVQDNARVVTHVASLRIGGTIVPQRTQHKANKRDGVVPRRGKCEHQRDRNKCRDCGGAGICEHQRRRSSCKDCGGASICEHQRQRQHCSGGVSICEHQRPRHQCRDCKGSSLCEHGLRRSTCRECEGSDICVHNRRRRRCNPCQRGDTAPAAWPSRDGPQEMDPIVRDVQLGVDHPPILADP